MFKGLFKFLKFSLISLTSGHPCLVYGHIVVAALSLIALYCNVTYVVPVLSIILFVVGMALDFETYKKCDILLWSSMITVAPIWLGQPISLNTGGLEITSKQKKPLEFSS